MRAGLFETWPKWLLLSVTLGACSNIIGISGYEIDPSLDPDSGEAGEPGEGGTGADAGSSSGGTTSGGQAGEAPGGATSVVGGAHQGGDGGAGTCAERCDDEITCTVDSCDDDGECLNTPDSALCDEDADECATCEAGIGCVTRDATTLELLANPSFDATPKIWRELLEYTEQTLIIETDQFAETPDYSAYFGALADPESADDQAYAGIYQTIAIPEGTKQLRVTGFYEVYPGLYLPSMDDLTVALYEIGVASSPAVLFHTWTADDGEIGPWAAFEYLAPAAQLASVVGTNVTFDVFAYTWDSSFYVDSLSLQATVCE
jgi:hypothetical protein